VVEVFNARAFVGAWNRRAAEAAEAKRLPGFAGSDAHFGFELGRVYTEMPAFTDARSFLAAFPHARLGRLRTVTPLVHAGSITMEVLRTVLRRRRNGGR
jgi:predicted metal-dependent phosphoesterase TrpH